MTPRGQSLLRLLAVQASWTYERMAGIGVGHAAAPLLRELFHDRSARERRAAVARSAEYFNSHPYLAGVAVGAVVRAERDGVPGAGIIRLRTALSGPLGSIGDQLVWAGEVPALMGLALGSVPFVGWWAVVAVVVIHNVMRLKLTAWGLDLGLREGLHVGAALQQSWLPTAASQAQRLAAFAVGLGVPIVVQWLLVAVPPAIVPVILATGVVGSLVVVAPLTQVRVTGIRLGIVLMILAWCAIGVLR